MSKELFYKFVENKNNVPLYFPIVKNLLRQRKSGNKYKIKGYGEIKQEDLTDPIKVAEVFDYLIKNSIKNKNYDASIFPTLISKNEAPNFYFKNEKPAEEEIYWILYLLFSGLSYRDYVINLYNVNEKLREDFRKFLINEEKTIFLSSSGASFDIGKAISSILEYRSNKKINFKIKEFILSFVFLLSFIRWIKKNLENKKEENILSDIEEILPDYLEKLDIRENVGLVVFNIPKTKKEIYFFPRIKKIILRWCSNYLLGKTDRLDIAYTIFSFYIPHKDYVDKSVDLLNKFLYYFLQNRIDGKLLNELIILKIEYSLKERKKSNIMFAKTFFEKL